MSTRPYPSYKDSGVKWLGRTPAHWQIHRLKHVANVQPSNVDKKSEEGESPVRLCNYVDVYYHDRITADMDFMRATATEEEKRKFQLRVGDVCVTKDSEEWSDIAVPACVVDDVPDLLCGYHLALVRPRPGRTDGEFLARAFSARGVNDQFRVEANGITRFALGQDALCNALFPVPPLDEQQNIASFLDRETGRIDALVKKKERFLELLQEQRTALISHAVTQGLNLNAAKKNSGIPWLGNVPQHWSVAPVSSRYSVQLGKMLDTTKIIGEHLRPYLRVFDVQWGNINTDDLPQMDFHTEARAKFRLNRGDLLVNEGGSYPGRSAIWVGKIEECYYQKALHRLRSHRPEKDTTRFFYYVMCWAVNQGVFVAGGNETTIEHLPAEKLRKYRFAFPPIKEQVEIASLLDTELAKLDALMAKVRTAIERLQEYRTALISAAVTGQIDVREAVQNPFHL